MNELLAYLVAFGWKILGGLSLLASGITKILGEVILLLGCGICCIGGALNGTSAYLYERGGKWITAEPGFKTTEKADEVREYDPYCVTEE